MRSQIRSELLKLTTVRTSLYFALATVVFVGGMVSIQAITAGSEFIGPLSEEPTQRSLYLSASAAPLIAIVFGCLGVTSELRHHTIVPTLLFEAGRVRVLAAKAAAMLVAGAGLGAIAVVVGVALTTLILAATNTPVLVGVGPVAATTVGTVGASALGSLFGLGIGGLVRNQAMAVGAVLILLLALEPLVVSLVPDVGPWLPSSLVTVIAEGQPGAELTLWLAVSVLAAYAIVVTAGAALALRRADVT